MFVIPDSSCSDNQTTVLRYVSLLSLHKYQLLLIRPPLLPEFQRSFLQGYIQKLASLIQPAISSNKDKDCQVYALKLWTGLLEKSKSDETSTVGPGHSNEIKSALVELLPRGIPLLLTSMAVPISDQEIAV